jgi:precorrin-2 dehydrogenase/sirohydrochlorin ferrochelatase
METFPAFFPLAGRRIVIAGEGEPAEAKARLFAGSPAVIVRLSPEEATDPNAYAGAALVFVASRDEALNQAAAAAARGSGAPLNVVDHPELSDFHTPGIVDRGQVVAAIGTGGAAPVLASILRAELEARIPPGVGEIARLLGERRAKIVSAFPDFALRRAFFRRCLMGPAARAAAEGDLAGAAARVDAALTENAPRQGQVCLIEAPPQADRLSLRALRALSAADIVVMGEGAEEILNAHARRDVERWTEADADRLGAAALHGDLVVVLNRHVDRDLAARLRAGGVAVESLAPAPCP